MAAQRLRGLREVERERLAHRDEAVKECARKAHVVVDDERPVVGCANLGEHPVQILELPPGQIRRDRLRSEAGLG
jgi:hypothetical protein